MSLDRDGRIGCFEVFNEQASMEERREFKRLKYGVHAEVSYYQKEPREREVLSKLHTKDISAGGIRIALTDKLDAGAIVSVKLMMPYSDREISCFAQVAWVSPAREGKHETGLAFTGLTEKEKAVINSFVEDELDKGIE